MNNINYRLILVFILPLFAGILLSKVFRMQPVQAATLIVNTIADENDGCTIGDCSLREAITEANNNTGVDIITFDLPANSTIILSGSQLPSITDDLIIDGSTSMSLTVSGNNQSNILVIGSNYLPNISVTISQLTISNGEADFASGIFNWGALTINNSLLSNNSAKLYGGGIYNRGALTITNSTLDANSAQDGAGINNQGGNVYLSQTHIIGNSAQYGGGIKSYGSGTVNVIIANSLFQDNTAIAGAGIFNDGIWNGSANITITHSTFSQNIASEKGGGMYNNGSVGYAHVLISESTFDNNVANHQGGGIENYSSDNYSADVTINNSTFSQNSANVVGGGALNWGISSHMTLNNSTFSENSSDKGGGIYNTDNGELILRNSIIANSVDGKDCQNLGTMVAFNTLIEGTGWEGACDLTNGTNNNIIGQDPKLGPLVDNGGQTLTYALLLGSLAIDQGDNATCLAIDQRDINRPLDGDNNGSAICDIGALEALHTILNEIVFLPVIIKP